VSLHGRLGGARNVVDGFTPAGQIPIDGDGRKTGVLAGFGVQWRFMPGISLRGDVTTYGKSSARSRAGSVNGGVAVHF
jgi:hypothetical protein